MEKIVVVWDYKFYGKGLHWSLLLLTISMFCFLDWIHVILKGKRILVKFNSQGLHYCQNGKDYSTFTTHQSHSWYGKGNFW